MRPRLALAASLVLALPVLAACGPVSVAEAERSCLRDADLAQRPRGAVSVGVVSDGGRIRPASSVEIEVSGDYLAGRDPAEVFARCVQRRSGQPPTAPLYEQPAWRPR